MSCVCTWYDYRNPGLMTYETPWKSKTSNIIIMNEFWGVVRIMDQNEDL